MSGRRLHGGVDAEIDAEIRFHFEERVEELVAGGLTADAARERAHEEFGDLAMVRAGLVRIDRRMARRRRRREGMMLWWADVRHSARRLAQTPGFLATTLLTLGLGIGSVTAVFGVVDAVALRPLPYPVSDRIVQLQNAVPALDNGTWGVAKGQLVHFAQESQSFEALGLYQTVSAAARPLSRDGEAVYARIARVSTGVADILSARVARGRLFRQEEELPGAAPVVVLTDAYWRNALGADPAVLGSQLEINGGPYEIVGVLAPDVRMPEEVAYGDAAVVDLWMPIPLDPAAEAQNHHVFSALGRLRPEVSLEAAAAELEGLAARFPETLPTAYSERFMSETGFRPQLVALRDGVVGEIAKILWILLGAVGVVLLITCFNVANLFLVRGESRRRELAVRAVLGAGRGDLTRHRLAETLLVTLSAGVLGIAFAGAGMRMLVLAAPTGMRRLPEVGLHAPTIALALGLALVTGLLFGVFPRPHAGGEGGVLGEAGRGNTMSRRRRFVHSALITTQIGLCFTLLAGAGLLLRSFAGLSAVDPGFSPAGVLTFRIVLPSDRYGDPESSAAFHQELTRRLEALPGVRAVGMGTSLPLGGLDGCTGVRATTGETAEGRGECIPVIYHSPGYLSALGIPVRGEEPDWPTLSSGRQLAVISGNLARRYWGPAEPLEREVVVGGAPAPQRIVGVAADIRNDALDAPPAAVLYVPIYPPLQRGNTFNSVAVVVATSLEDPLTLLPAVRSTLTELDARVPLTRARTMEDIVATSMSRLTFTATLLVIAACMALVIGAVGIYGVVSFSVAQRRGEIGVRVALGATAGEVRRLVIGRTVMLAGIGVLAGMLITLPLAQLLESLLYGVSPADPLTLAGVGAFLLLLAGAASHAPARRALRVSPVEALRGT